MNDKQLKTFICAAEQKSFSKAATMSYISASALNSQMSTLEKSVGVTLFDRTTHGVELTREGEYFLDTAREIMRIYEDAQEQCRQMQNKEVLLMSLQSLNAGRVRTFTLQYQITHPEMAIELVDMEDYRIMDALEEGNLQIVFGAKMAGIDPEKLEYYEVFEDIYRITVRNDHPLAGKELITPMDLLPYKVNVSDSPAREVNPADVLRKYGVEVKPYSQEGMNEAVFANPLLRNEVLMSAGPVMNEQLKLYVRIPTNISAGSYGFLYRADAGRTIREFVKAYVKDWVLS